MKNLLFVALLFLPIAGYSQKPAKEYSYVEELRNLFCIEKLPSYRDLCIVEQVSSYDPTGGNNDGFEGTYSYIRKENGKLILADLQGPGVINRIWTPTPTNDTLEFYFDGEKHPRLKICFNDLFSGKVFPFIPPLCGNEIGGFYCYLPIPYSKSCKIAFTGEVMRFHQIQYRNLPGYRVKSFSETLTPEEEACVRNIDLQWKAKSGTLLGQYRVSEETFVLEPGSERMFFSRKQGGRVVGFEIDDNSYFEGNFKDILLYASWDNEPIPAIYAPAADFFGYSFGKPSMKGLLAGKNGDVNYCHIPCPYDDSAEMKLIYKKREGMIQPSVLIKTKIYYEDKPRNPAKEGKLYTSWRREINPAKGKYYEFASGKGKGHYIGTIHQTQGLLPEMTVFFEGDDSTHIDGKMRIHGTGSEDYYNGGWYALPDRWDTGLSLPLHGSLEYAHALSRTGGYRFYLTDKLTFEKELYQGIEHGPERNEYPVDYTSVAFYYSDKPLAKGMLPEDNLREIYPPSEFRFYPQLMKFTLFHGTNIHYNRGICVSSKYEGGIKLFLDGIPEGKYKIYLSYYNKPGDGCFAVWHRQKLVQDWKSISNTEEKFNEKQYIGEADFTFQTNSLTIKTKNCSANDKAFEFDCLYLKKISD